MGTMLSHLVNAQYNIVAEIRFDSKHNLQRLDNQIEQFQSMKSPKMDQEIGLDRESHGVVSTLFLLHSATKHHILYLTERKLEIETIKFR